MNNDVMLKLLCRYGSLRIEEYRGEYQGYLRLLLQQ